MKQEECDRRYM